MAVELRGPSLGAGSPGQHTNAIRPGESKLLDMNEVCPEALTRNTAVGYSGRHDDGNLSQLRSCGPLLEVVSALKEAKQACDAFLTDIIESNAAPVSVVKKARIEEDDDQAEGEEG